ncbi:MAG: lysophospholipase [Eubacteriales bacterium]|nr:lysophospholipase [Eubacteriales bacterium]
MIKDTFLSVTGETLDKCLWPVEGEAKGIVQLVHGMAEHIDRYDGVACALNAAGYIVVGHTHLGHGPNAKIKGYFTDKNGWDALLDDTHRLRKDTQAQFPRLPYFLLGHSMGSFVVRTYCLKYEAGLAGVIISGTGHFDKPILAAGSAIAGLQCLLGQGQKPSMILHNMNFSANNKQVDNPKTESDWLSRDEEQVAKYNADPLCGFPFTARAYADLFTGLKQLYPDKLGAMIKDIPILIFSGDHDPVGANGKGVTKVYEELKAAGVKDVTLKLYPDGRHEMFNELNREEVYADLASWLGAKL